MNENKHTPEPWSVDPDSTDYYASILDADGADTILLGDYGDWWMTKANARRIVACVNACAGIETGHLEKYGLPDLAQKISDLRKQRDELLEQVECSNITEKNMEGRLNKLIVQNAATKDRLDEHRDGRLSALEKLAVAEKQRDELLAELQRFMDSHEECTDFDGFTAQIVSMADYHQAQEAIARVKGEQ